MRLLFKTLPPSTNKLYGRAKDGHVYLKPKIREAKEALGWEARTQFRGAPMKGPLSLSITIYAATDRLFDSDNKLKLLQDALTGIVWEDDSQIIQHHIRKAVDRKDPRVEMTVETTLL